MTTVTINLQSEKDTELLMSVIKSARFESQIETFVTDEDEFTDEDIAEFDRRMAELEKDPSKGRPVDEFMKELKDRYGL